MATNRFTEPVGTLFRLVFGLLFGLHGAAALFGVLGGAMGSGQPVPFGLWPDYWAGAIQFVGGFLVFLGLGTRFFALICSGSMAFAYFYVHQKLGLLPMQNGGEMAAMFAWSFLMIAVLGPGRYSLDNLFFGRRSSAPAATAPATSSGAPDKELAGVG